jgi:GT2 family glycosyltransferase
MVRVAVVILNWNGWEDTIDLLDSLFNVEYEPLTVVVVDNASIDESVLKIEAWLRERGVGHRILDWVTEAADASMVSRVGGGDDDREFIFIRSSENLGFCRGNNAGLEWAFSAGARFGLVLNNDTLVSPGFLAPMVDVARADPQVGLVGGVITYCSKPDIVWWAGGSFDRFLVAKRIHDGEPISVVPAAEPFETEWVSGCMMLIPAQVFTELGGFDEDFFIWSEEWDYSVRVARAGYKLIVVPSATICHKVGRSLGVMKPLNYYYGIRNGLLFKRKHLPRQSWYPYFIGYLVNRALRFTQLVLQGRFDLAKAGVEAVADFVRGRTGKWLRQV